MHPFIDARPLLADPRRLRARAAADGYLYLPGLVPLPEIDRVRTDILGVCERHGFLRAGCPRDAARANRDARCRENDPAYMAAYDDIQRLESFHALAHFPALTEALRSLLNDAVLVHPRNIARVMFPQNNRFTTPPHQDYVHVQGTQNTWTAWIPLGDCPAELGGVEVLSGSHRHGVLPVRGAYGAGGLGVETEHLGLAWHHSAFAAGNVLLFHSLTVHRGRDNLTEDRMRLSVDYRYQPVSEPVEARSLLPHFNRLTWEEIYAGWRRRDIQYYWSPLQLTLKEWSTQYHARAIR